MKLMAAVNEISYFDDALNEILTKNKDIPSCQRPIKYVTELLEIVKTHNRNIDKDILRTNIEKCLTTSGVLILPHLLDLANYLIRVIKTEPDLTSKNKDTTAIVNLNPLDSISTEAVEQESIEPQLEKSESFVGTTIKKETVVIFEKVQENPSMMELDHKDVIEKVTEKQLENHESDMLNAKEAVEEDKEYESDGEERDEDNLTAKDRKVLKRMEKYDTFIHKVKAKIHELENKEVSLDEMGEAETYAETILKERFVKAYNKLRQLCKDNPHLVDGEIPKKPPTQFSRPIVLKSSTFPEINAKLNKILGLKENKKFPDYMDIYEWVSEANIESKLNLSKEKCEEVAKTSFKEIGGILKRRRKIEQEQTFDSYIEHQQGFKELSEAETNEEVIKKLEQNKKLAAEQEEEILKAYASKCEGEVEENDANTVNSKSDNEDEEDDSCDESQSSEKQPESTTLDKESDDNQDNADGTESTCDPNDFAAFDDEEEEDLASVGTLKISAKRTSQDIISNGTPSKRVKLEDSIELKPKFVNSLGISILSAGSSTSLTDKSAENQEDNECIVLD